MILANYMKNLYLVTQTLKFQSWGNEIPNNNNSYFYNKVL